MDYAPDVAVVHSINDLEYDLPRINLAHSPFLFYPLVQLSAPRALHDHDQLLALYKGVVELDDVLVLKLFKGFRFFVDVLDH